jgi:chromosome partitioning protein
MKTVAIVNQKGGCGKTTTAINLSAALAIKGYKVLLVDLDAQAHASLGLGIELHNLEKTIYEVLINPEIKMSQVIKNTGVDNLHLVPSNILLSGAEVDLINVIGRENILSNALSEIVPNYDFIFIDCSPSLNLLVVNALVAADGVLIPVQTHYYALEGMKQLFNTIEIVKSKLNHSLCILGILLTFYDPRTNISKEVVSETRKHFKEKIFNTLIHTNVKLTEAPSTGKPIMIYESKSKGALDYNNLTDEVINRGK